jgi:hypothetical protein
MIQKAEHFLRQLLGAEQEQLRPVASAITRRGRPF